MKDTRIEKNKIVLDKFPPTDDTSHTHLGIWKSSENIIRNNKFISSSTKVAPIEVFDEHSANNDVDYNYWKVNSSDWKWNNNWRDDFQKSYQEVTGWDEHGEIETYKM